MVLKRALSNYVLQIGKQLQNSEAGWQKSTEYSQQLPWNNSRPPCEKFDYLHQPTCGDSCIINLEAAIPYSVLNSFSFI